MGRTACTEPQCLYKGALYFTSVPVQGCTLPYLSACTRGTLPFFYLYFTFRELALFRLLKVLLWVEAFTKSHFVFETSALYFSVDIAKDPRILQSSAITL